MAACPSTQAMAVPDRTAASLQVQRPCCPLWPRRPSSSAGLTSWLGVVPLMARGNAVAAPITPTRRLSGARREGGCAAAAEPGSGSGSDSAGEPQLAADAITAGLHAYRSGDHEGALNLFQRALTLPGTGLKRYRDKPRECSDEEKQAALYNTACCLGAMGNPQDGLKAVAGALEAGYSDYQQLRRDPDLAPLRENEKFEGLLKRFEPGGGFFGPLLRGFGS